MIKTANANLRFKIAMTTVMLVALSFMLAGCSIDAPLAPSTQQLDGLEKIELVEDLFGDDLFAQNDSEKLGKKVYVVDQVDTRKAAVLIGAEGGTLSLTLGGDRTELIVPPGALKKTVRITAKVVSYHVINNGELTFYDFGPDGLVFQKPATLTLETQLKPGTRLTLLWWNPNRGVWQVEASSRVNRDGEIRFLIRHFSKYAIS